MKKSRVLEQTFNPSTQELETDRSMWTTDQPSLHNELNVIQGYKVISCLKKQNIKRQASNKKIYEEKLKLKLHAEKIVESLRYLFPGLDDSVVLKEVC